MESYDDKIINNSYDNVEYGGERLSNTTIAINPAFADMYQEATTEKIEELYIWKEMRNIIANAYEESPYFERFGKVPKKIDRKSVFDIYYYFKDILMKTNRFDGVQIFCAIAEFFELNYKILYNDVLTIADKARVLEELQNQFGLHKSFSDVEKLF